MLNLLNLLKKLLSYVGLGDKITVIDDGFIPADPEPGDWEFGSDLTMGAKSLLESGDWIPIFKQIGGELQRTPSVETMSCVAFSATKIIEALIFVKYGKRLNISARFTAKMSGTSRSGNTFRRVAESLRKDGFVLEEDWPFDPSMTWDQYHSPIPDEVIMKGQSSLNVYNIKHEWVDTVKWPKLEKIFKQCALQLGLYAWAVNRLGQYFFPQGARYNHASIGANINWQDFDSYEPFVKQLIKDYPVYRWAKIFDVTKISADSPGEKLYERFKGKLVILPHKNGEVFRVNEDELTKVIFIVSDKKLFGKIHNVLKENKAFNGLSNENFDLLKDYVGKVGEAEDVVVDDVLLKALYNL